MAAKVRFFPLCGKQKPPQRLKDRKNFLDYHLNPAIQEGFVRLLFPDKPRHPRQKYLLTAKGLALYKEIV